MPRQLRWRMLPWRLSCTALATMPSMSALTWARWAVRWKRCPCAVTTMVGLRRGDNSCRTFCNACARFIPPTSIPATRTPLAITSVRLES